MSIYKAIPAFETLLTQWENKRKDPQFELYHTALDTGLDKLRKYYLKFDQKPAYILSLCMYLFSDFTEPEFTSYSVIHPYYKLHWIELHWGGAETQEAEIAMGHLDAKNWIDEADRIVEAKVCVCS